MLPLFQTLLHILYEEDVLEESAILTWYALCLDQFVTSLRHNTPASSPMGEKLHIQVKPLITWLQTAEEESEDESSEDSD